MALAQLVLECPYCYSLFEAEPPDRVRSAYSFEEPLRHSFYGEVVKQKLVCQNPKCKKQVIIYWYAPMDYFNRI